MRWIIEIFFAILLLPLALILGLLIGVFDFYSAFHGAINKKVMEGSNK